MNYVSTRDLTQKTYTASQAIVQGLAPDGGLFVPCSFPKVKNFLNLDYQQLALKILKLYLTDFSSVALKSYIRLAYENNLPVALNKEFLELFHGRTAAFKDVALQLFPYLLTDALKANKVEKTAVILTATSGDTGSAVLAGISNVPGTRAIVFYPAKGISEIQRLQMTTQAGENLNVFGINGNFDDAQKAVKEIFEDTAFQAKFADKYLFTSANSINLGRLLPQIVYYFYGYSQIVKAGRIKDGDKINFAVPTGNFGNILAGYYAYKMGLPINKLICASNENNVLYDFIKSGRYNRKRDFHITLSPSMDILVSSNLERFIYDISDCETVIRCYDSLKKSGEFTISQPMEMLECGYATDKETIAAIKKVYKADKYVMDPHTAVAYCVNEKYKKAVSDTVTLILSTASPHKFPETVKTAIGEIPGKVPGNLNGLKNKPVLHSTVTSNIRKSIAEVL